MRIWLLENPRDYSFAQAVGRGSWTESEGLCPECGGAREARIKPLIMVWEPGSDRIADFVWTEPAGVVVQQRVLDLLLARFTGFEPGLGCPLLWYQQKGECLRLMAS
jgi:hypothetical protein